MRTTSLFLLLAVSLVCASGQTVINGGRRIKGVWDASGALSTRPAKSGTWLPTTCALGEEFFKTDAPAGQNKYGCTAPNTWTQLGGSPITNLNQIGTRSYGDLQNIPSAFVPSLHRLKHAVGGDDALSPSDIGAQPALGFTPERPLTFQAPLQRVGDTISCPSCGGGGTGGSGAPNYSQAFTEQTLVVLTHNLGTKNVLIGCSDANDNSLEPSGWSISGTAPYDVTVTFVNAQTGRCVVNGTGSAKYVQDFVSQSSITINRATHGLSTADLMLTVFDDATPRKRVEPDTFAVDPVTKDVTVTFAVPQSGRLILQ